ncbi:BTAD domain-containing putative transcriptional regulator [Blastococcus tunisiensis]|uniref:BTAD domain-containing putative transcriptional regulator n=1 Tax=Blastococcus tunisiensis TaxID=1798228 RepID=UPI001C3171F0|nr:BTAD domain-containing putative transcriptional regulator [Blastococcus sp. DSM 46838]
MPAVTFRVLGPVTASDAVGPVDLKGPRHRAVLARLLIARGRTVSLARLIDDLWDKPPDGAAGAVQTFVGALRRALEPDRPARTPSRLLVTVAGGYALRAEDVDAERFEAAVASAGELLAAGRAAEARSLLDEALEPWCGPAYAEFAEHPWARAEANRLEELRLLALHRRAEALLGSGRAAEAVPELESLVAGHPLRESTWRLLGLALYQAGRQGDALAALRRARSMLLTELGVDPGPELGALEADILDQVPALSPAPPAPTPPAPPREAFVGRGDELAALEAAARTAAADAPRLVLLSGAAGAGKTALARRLADRLAASGWRVAWGTSPESAGAPVAWPWAQMRDQLEIDEAEDSADDPVAARFHRHRSAASALTTLSADRPVLLVFDDLHWADEETLALLSTLATDRGLGRVLILGTHRSTDVTPGLAGSLARVARAEPTRLYLGGLTEAQTRELVESLSDREIAPEPLRLLHTRSGGNPFLARELIRVREAEGDAALSTVPAGVRDVVRHRLARLPERARTHLRQAAVQGIDVDLEVQIRLSGDEEAVLESVEAALLVGFLVERDADQLSFSHALVQETLYDDVPSARRTRWHAAIAKILEAVRPDHVETIASHLLRAGSRAPADRVAHFTRIAAQRAEQRSAPHAAASWWHGVITALDRSAGDPRARLEATTGLIRALAVTGDLAQARRLRTDAVDTAERLADPVLTAAVVGASDVPAIWTTNDDEALSTRLVEVAERTLTALPPSRRAERARLLITIALERRADEGPRGAAAAHEAEDIARALRDPALLASGLNGRFLQSFQRAGLAPERARIGEEIVAVTSGSPELAAFEVLGHLILVQARSALADFATADRHAAAADELANHYGLPVVGVFTAWYAAMKLAALGRFDEARPAYRAAATRLTGTGMSGLEEGLLPLALLSVDVLEGRPATHATYGPFEPWIRPLVLLGQGDRHGALTALHAVPDSPRDLLYEARTCIHALAAVQLGEQAAAVRLRERLLPAAGELAGAGSGLLTLGPTSRYLGHLASLLGRRDPATEHYRHVQQLAEQVGSRTGSPPRRSTPSALSRAEPLAVTVRDDGAVRPPT